MNNTQDNYSNIKAAVLAGMSGYAAAKKYGVDPLSVAKRLSLDPDIVKAKADGTVKSRAKRHKTTTHYANLDYVKAVMEDGMTQTAAAARFGKAQAQVAFGVKKAREELVALGEDLAKPRTAPKTTSTTPSGATNPPNDPEIVALKALVTAYAQRHGLATSEVLRRLAD